jgi:hypothetical protein
MLWFVVISNAVKLNKIKVYMFLYCYVLTLVTDVSKETQTSKENSKKTLFDTGETFS